MKLGIVMDPIGSIKIKKDSSFALLLAAQARGWSLYYLEQNDLYLRDGRAWGRLRVLRVTDDANGWFEFLEERHALLDELDVILMRKDPPFDMEYVYSTYLLERAEHAGTLVVNKPQGLRDANEKLYTAWFADCCAPTLVSRDAAQLRAFLGEHEEIVMKPLDGMGGASIFRIHRGDFNISVVIETLTNHGRRSIMAQRFIPEIARGDKRVLVIDGKPAPYSLARIPRLGETRGNLAAGGTGVAQPLSARDRDIAEALGPELQAQGLLLVGLDVIGDWLTEVNVTSPTCMREIADQTGFNVAALMIDALERLVSRRE